MITSVLTADDSQPSSTVGTFGVATVGIGMVPAGAHGQVKEVLTFPGTVSVEDRCDLIVAFEVESDVIVAGWRSWHFKKGLECADCLRSTRFDQDDYICSACRWAIDRTSLVVLS